MPVSSGGVQPQGDRTRSARPSAIPRQTGLTAHVSTAVAGTTDVPPRTGPALSGRSLLPRLLKAIGQTGSISNQLNDATNHAGSRSLPFFDRYGSVHAARLKQQGRRFPLFIFEILTSTRRLRVSGFWVALTQRTHSQRAIGVIPSHTSRIFCGAAARAVSRSCGTFGSGQ